MRINETNPEYLRSDQLKGVRGGAEGGPKDAPQPTGPVTRTDKVQISDAGRALAAQAAPEDSSAELSPERAAEIRQRILQGAYDSLDVVDQVARRMLAQGDI
jgi:hypothetical protein